MVKATATKRPNCRGEPIPTYFRNKNKQTTKAAKNPRLELRNSVANVKKRAQKIVTKKMIKAPDLSGST